MAYSEDEILRANETLGALSDVVETSRWVSEVYTEAGNQATREVHASLRKLVKLFKKIDSKQRPKKRNDSSLVAPERTKNHSGLR